MELLTTKTKGKIAILGLLFFLAIVMQFFQDDLIGITGSTTKRGIPTETGAYEVYMCQTDNCKDVFVNTINNAQQLKCAFYDLTHPDIIEALKKHPNLQLLIFEDYYEGLGTPVSSMGLMHNKFCIIDEKTILTGSTNPTINGIEHNDNNLFLIESENLVRNYNDEFEELAGSFALRTVRYPFIDHDDFRIENYFCPEDACEQRVVDKIRKAKSKVYFMTFSFTSDPIGAILIDRENELDIKGVFESRQESPYSEYQKMKSVGMNVKLDGNPQTMHHKVFLIDDDTVIFGSYNPSKNGNIRNDENILIIHNKDIYNKFYQEFERVWALS